MKYKMATLYCSKSTLIQSLVHEYDPYSTVYSCVAKGPYFTVHRKFSIFEIKYLKKGDFFCLTVYYPPLDLKIQ